MIKSTKFAHRIWLALATVVKKQAALHDIFLFTETNYCIVKRAQMLSRVDGSIATSVKRT